MSEESSFTDPVVRCTECQRLITRQEIQQVGCCPKCSCRRVRNVLTLEGEEMKRAKKEWPEFAALFESKATGEGAPEVKEDAA